MKTDRCGLLVVHKNNIKKNGGTKMTIQEILKKTDEIVEKMHSKYHNVTNPAERLAYSEGYKATTAIKGYIEELHKTMSPTNSNLGYFKEYKYRTVFGTMQLNNFRFTNNRNIGEFSLLVTDRTLYHNLEWVIPENKVGIIELKGESIILGYDFIGVDNQEVEIPEYWSSASLYKSIDGHFALVND